jgi:hypothetical protein
VQSGPGGSRDEKDSKVEPRDEEACQGGPSSEVRDGGQDLQESGAPVRAEGLRLRAWPLGLEGLDRLQAEALLLGLPSDERPLKGAAGCCDWRLLGRLSRLLKSGDFGARRDEALLTDTRGRIGAPRVLLIGLGPAQALDLAGLRHGIRQMLVVAKKARFQRLALEVPGLGRGRVADAELARTFLDVAARAHPGAELDLLISAKPAGEALRAAARAVGARWLEDGG